MIRDRLVSPSEAIQIAVASGHGPGKSALVGAIPLWALYTLPDTKGVVTANTEKQLRTKTWPELAKWHRLCVIKGWFHFGATSIYSTDKAHEETWRLDQIPWSERSTEAFAGLHNKGRRILFVMDEASAIPDVIWEVAEGALTDSDTEILWCAFGNPTRNTGRFRECFGRFKHRWDTRQIDSRTAKMTNKDQLYKWIEDYGDDSDFVRVRVKGEFPRAGSNQFIPTDVVQVAREYEVVGFERLPKVLSLDVARFGDDENVCILRQGRKAVILDRWRDLDTVSSAERLVKAIQTHKPHAIVIDGDGIGGGVVDQVRARGFHRCNGHEILFEFHGGASARDPMMYFNRRAEIWGLMRDWLKAGADIPDTPEIETDLTGPEYGFDHKGRIQLEKKEDMKRRGLASPNIGDALAMSFAVVVSAELVERLEDPEESIRRALWHSWPSGDGNDWMG